MKNVRVNSIYIELCSANTIHVIIPSHTARKNFHHASLNCTHLLNRLENRTNISIWTNMTGSRLDLFGVLSLADMVQSL